MEKFAWLLCSNYVHSVIVHTLSKTLGAKEGNISSTASERGIWNFMALTANSRVVVHEIGELRHSMEREAIPVFTQDLGVSFHSTMEVAAKVLVLMDRNQLTLP